LGEADLKREAEQEKKRKARKKDEEDIKSREGTRHKGK